MFKPKHTSTHPDRLGVSICDQKRRTRYSVKPRHLRSQATQPECRMLETNATKECTNERMCERIQDECNINNHVLVESKKQQLLCYENIPTKKVTLTHPDPPSVSTCDQKRHTRCPVTRERLRSKKTHKFPKAFYSERANMYGYERHYKKTRFWTSIQRTAATTVCQPRWTHMLAVQMNTITGSI